MRRATIFGVCLAATAVVTSCNNNESNPVNPGIPTKYGFGQLAVLDTTGYFVMRYSGYDRTEPFLTTEKILGEPFTDSNGNGVYDAGVDGFTISSDPARNQDLNHNGKYDGPDAIWTPGIPFDDIDGNGVPRTEDDGYLPGVPFCDFNHDGKRDGDPFWTDIYSQKRYAVDPGGEYFRFEICDSAFSFTSDSGVHYVVSTNTFDPGWGPQQSFVRSNDTLYLGPVPILCGDSIAAESVVDSLTAWGSPRLVFTRTTTLNTTYSFFGTEISGLVQVVVVILDATPVNYKGMVIEMYFSPDKGPIGYVYRTSYLVQEQLYYFGERVASLPIGMRR